MIISSTSSINSLRQAETSASVQARSTSQGGPEMLSRTETKANDQAAAQTGGPAKSKKPAVDEKASSPTSKLSDVSPRYRVDQETGDVFVYMVDPASKKVLRTIPISELAKMSNSEIVNLTA